MEKKLANTNRFSAAQAAITNSIRQPRTAVLGTITDVTFRLFFLTLFSSGCPRWFPASAGELFAFVAEGVVPPAQTPATKLSQPANCKLCPAVLAVGSNIEMRAPPSFVRGILGHPRPHTRSEDVRGKAPETARPCSAHPLRGEIGPALREGLVPHLATVFVEMVLQAQSSTEQSLL